MSKPCDPEFRDEIDRRVRIAVQEIRDGCNDCGDFPCDAHRDQIDDLVLHPKTALAKYERERLSTDK